MNAMSDVAKAALHDVVVVDFSELLPGPFMTQMLADMGASIIKIERPPHGDPVRQSAPGLFASVNHSKECVQIDLKDSAGVLKAIDLIKNADVLVESFRPGTLARLGLGYQHLKSLNPRLIYVSLSGYGQSGPDAMLPGHDLNYLAAAGAMALTPGKDRSSHPDAIMDVLPSGLSALPYADLGGALYGLGAVLAALYQRQFSGQGQWLDVSLTEAVLHQMTVRLAVFQQNGVTDLRGQRESLERAAYGCFECQDGRFVTLGAIETHFFVRLVHALGLSEFEGEVWADAAYRKLHKSEINRSLARRFLEMSSTRVVDILRKFDVPIMPVIMPNELSEHPQHVARGVFEPSLHGELPRFPVRLAGMRSQCKS